MTPAGPFEDALARLASVFRQRGASYAVIDGLAVAAWGAPRATEGIDLLASRSWSRAPRGAASSTCCGGSGPRSALRGRRSRRALPD